MTRNEYDLNPKLCLHCGTAIPFEKRANKFCNSSCSATFNNTGKKHSEEHKAAIAASVNAYNALIGKVAKPNVKIPKTKTLKVKKEKIKIEKPPRNTNALVNEKENFDLEKYKSLYSDVVGVVGIYVQTHITKPRIILIVRLTSGKTQTRSYPRAIMELYLGRILNYPEETVDHIDSNPMNNRIENLQIVSQGENTKKAHRDGLYSYNPKDVPIPHIDANGSKNGMSKISEEEVLRYRREYTSGRSKKSIVDECGLSIRTVENFLFGRSFKLVPEKCEPRPYERST